MLDRGREAGGGGALSTPALAPELVADGVPGAGRPVRGLGHGLGRRIADANSTAVACRLALATQIGAVTVLVLLAAARPSFLVPESQHEFPAWMAGPLHALTSGVSVGAHTLNVGLSVVLVAITLAYGVVIWAARSVSMRTIWLAVLAVHVVLLAGPPLQFTDLFNYLGYARMASLHHLNPYTHVIAQAAYDPVFPLTTWHHLHSPYGPLFTILTYPLGWMSIGLAYWTLKLVIVSLSLAFLWLVAWCAGRLGRDPRLAVAFVALNPLYLYYALGAFHNDFVMLVPATAAVALIISGRGRAAGAALVAAVAVKFTAGVLLPFLLVAAGSGPRRRSVITGAVVAAIPLALLSVALFGLTLPNLSDQSSLLTPYSVPNLIGYAFGIGSGMRVLLDVADLLLVVLIVYLLVTRREWISGAGWATLALIVSLPWLAPWYVVWLLPLAALGKSRRLRGAALALSCFLLLTYLPAGVSTLTTLGFDPTKAPAYQTSVHYEASLE